MTNFLDLKYLRQLAKMLRDMAEDPEQAAEVVARLDQDPELREELSRIYVLAKRTLERASKS